jgi:hypothetical protein
MSSDIKFTSGDLREYTRTLEITNKVIAAQSCAQVAQSCAQVAQSCAIFKNFLFVSISCSLAQSCAQIAQSCAKNFFVCQHQLLLVNTVVRS